MQKGGIGILRSDEHLEITNAYVTPRCVLRSVSIMYLERMMRKRATLAVYDSIRQVIEHLHDHK